MEKRIAYLKTPWTVVTLIVFIFWLWWIRASLNFRINKLEEFQHSVDMVEIQSTLTAMKKDIERIRIQLQK